MKKYVLGCFAILLFGIGRLYAQDVPIVVPEGFKVELFANDDLATNIYSLTVNTDGEIVVAGPGYIKTLHDTDGNGIADQAQLFSESPKQDAQGLFFEGSNLYCTGDGGLWLYRDDNGDGVSDGVPEKKLAIKTGGEHDAHAIRRGPDGWLYVICGNGVPIRDEYFDGRNSPVKKPRAGFVLRISPDWKHREIYAHGFRNAYDFDFDVFGNLMTYDSDGERDISMPWYQPTRVYALRPGDDAGFVSPSWKRPDYYLDMPLVTARLGRGSPTGVVSYQHHQFPSEYFNSTFVLDWTFGRIVSIQPAGEIDGKIDGVARFKTKVFASGRDNFGFAPTDMEVAPDGSLFVAVGGRGTRGGVYRISYVGKKVESKFASYVPQPLSSWGSKAIRDAKNKIDPGFTLSQVSEKSRAIELRIGALQVLRESQTITEFNDAVECLWSMREFPLVLRLQVEHFRLSSKMKKLEEFEPKYGIQKEMALADSSWKASKMNSFYCLSKMIGEDLFADNGIRTEPKEIERVVRAQNKLPLAKKPTKNVYTGYEAESIVENPDIDLEWLGRISDPSWMKTQSALMRLEVSRLMSLAVSSGRQQPIRKNGSQLIDFVSASSNPIDNIHYLICLAVINPQLSNSHLEKLADALLQIVPNLKQKNLNRDRNWSGHMRDIVNRLVQNYPELATSIVNHDLFGTPDSEYLFFVAKDRLRGPGKKKAARYIKSNPGDPAVDRNMLLFVSSEIEADLELLETLWVRQELQPALLQMLSRKADSQHYEKFVTGLGGSDIPTIKRSTTALIKMSPEASPQIIVPAIKILGRLGWDKNDQSIRDQIVHLLRQQTGEDMGFVFGEKGQAAQTAAIGKWREFASKKYSEQYRQVFKNLDVARWTAETLASADWSSGDADRGAKLYQSLSFAKCHDGSTASGPRLEGITRRFSREDLFKTITDPNDQVSSRYRTLIVETTEGEILKGLVIYESTDGLTMIDDQNETIRIEQNEIDNRETSLQSIMPTGLLDKTKAQDWADLYEFLKSLK